MNMSSYGWNPLLSPSYSSWTSTAANASRLINNGISSQSLSALTSAQTDNVLFNASPSSSLYDYATISSNAYQLLYRADNAVTNVMTGSSVSPQQFFEQTQTGANPLFSSPSPQSSLFTAEQTSVLESSAPQYYLNTFNPYHVLGNGTTYPGSLFNTLA